MIALSTGLIPYAPDRQEARIEGLLAHDIAAFELNAGNPRDELRALLRELRLARRRIESVQTFCALPRETRWRPGPIPLPSASALDGSERAEFLTGLLEALEHAALAEARIVVVDGGSPGEPPSRRLSPAARAEEVRPYFDALRSTLDAALEAADRREIRLALRNPDQLLGLPSPAELRSLRQEFEGGPLVSWYDPARAHHVAQGEGSEPSAWRKAFAETAHGFTIQDWKDGSLGLAPGRGSLRFEDEILSPEESVPRVLDYRSLSSEDREESIEFLRGLGLNGDSASRGRESPQPWPGFGDEPDRSGEGRDRGRED